LVNFCLRQCLSCEGILWFFMTDTWSQGVCKSPVIFIIFNRPDLTEIVFRRIAQARPSRLLLVADGPRATKAGERELCERVRQIVSNVDWPCEVLTNFSDINLGCRNRVISGLNWAFEQVPEAIILEDDIVPDPSFFSFCDEMLARFRDDSRVSMVTGYNIVEDQLRTPYSYYFSHLSHIWGWATWRSSWIRYDQALSAWPAVRAENLLANVIDEPGQRRFWNTIFDEMHQGTGPDTWDYQWVYTNFIHHALSIVPQLNLVENIGFGPDATHTTRAQDQPRLVAKPLGFPLRHPPGMIPLRAMDRLDGRLSGSESRTLPWRIANRLRRMIRRR
jgi:hypothetical protein